MNTEANVEQVAAEELYAPDPFPKAWWGKLSYGLFATLLPVLLFSAVDILKPDWQTGKLEDYVILLLFPQASLLFFPLLAYSIVCYLLLLLSARRYSTLFIVRFGIYTGTLLALQYCLLVILYSLETFAFVIVLIWFLSALFSFALPWMKRRWGMRNINIALGVIALCSYLISSLALHNFEMPLSVLFIGISMAAPFWLFLLVLRASIWLFRPYETRPTRMQTAGLAAWFAGYAIAWRFDILKMYELYAALPPQPPPDCYIATAAAQGHPQFVRSRVVLRENGTLMRVNQQLQILKCAELALMAIHPRLHKVLRRIYDVIGRSLAKRMQNPYLADMAYLLLKPWERVAYRALRIIIPEIDSISKKMYLAL